MHKSFPNKKTYLDWLKAFWARARGVGLDEMNARLIVDQLTGSISVSAMSMDQFRAWFKRVDEIYGERKSRTQEKKRGRRKRPLGDNVIEIATMEQISFVRSFAWNKLGWKKYWNDNLTECESISKIIRRHTRGRKGLIRQLTKREARSVIEALKSIHKRKKAESR